MTRALYPGSFDPMTRGHMNIVEQASDVFDEVIIAVMQNPLKKTCFFTIEERLEIISELYKNADNIKVVTGTGATVDIALMNECKAIIRGIRSVSDFDYENRLQQVNSDISDNRIRTLFLFGDIEYQYYSSTMVRELYNLDKDVSKYVDPVVHQKMLIKKRGIK